MSKIHKLTLGISSVIAPVFNKNLKVVKNGVIGISKNMQQLHNQQSKLKQIKLDVTQFEKTKNSLIKLKKHQTFVTEEIKKYEKILSTSSTNTQSYVDAKNKLKLLNGEYKKSTKAVDRLELKNNSLKASLDKNGIKTNNLAMEKLNLSKRMDKLNGRIKKNIGGTNLQTNSMKKQIGVSGRLFASMKNLIGIGIAYFSVTRIKSFYTSSIQYAKDQMKAETDLRAMMNNNKHLKGNQKAVKKATKELIAHAGALQKVGVIGDEVTIAGQSQMATFQLQTSSIKTLSVGMLDMLAKNKGLNATQQDATNIANLMGKVMTGQVSALSRYGVTLTGAQKKVLKLGTEQERAAMLAKVLEENYGGANSALRNTPQGIIQSLNMTWGDMKENIGKKVLPKIAEFSGYIQKNMPVIEKIIGNVTDGFIIASKFIVRNRELIGTLVAGYIAYKTVIGAITLYSKIATAAQWAWNVAMNANPIGLIVLAIAGLIAILVTAYKNCETFRKIINKVWEGLKIAFDFIMKPIKILWSWLEKIWNFWAKIFGSGNKKKLTVETINKTQYHQNARGGPPAYAQNPNMRKYAKGGLVTQPTVALIGEAGDREMVIPINNTQGAHDLYFKTGEMLGLNSTVPAKRSLGDRVNQFLQKTEQKINQTVITVEKIIIEVSGVEPQKAKKVGESIGEGLRNRLLTMPEDGGRVSFG